MLSRELGRLEVAEKERALEQQFELLATLYRKTGSLYGNSMETLTFQGKFGGLYET
jgi:hypothetical protein